MLPQEEEVEGQKVTEGDPVPGALRHPVPGSVHGGYKGDTSLKKLATLIWTRYLFHCWIALGTTPGSGAGFTKALPSSLTEPQRNCST